MIAGFKSIKFLWKGQSFRRCFHHQRQSSILQLWISRFSRFRMFTKLKTFQFHFQLAPSTKIKYFYHHFFVRSTVKHCRYGNEKICINFIQAEFRFRNVSITRFRRFCCNIFSFLLILTKPDAFQMQCSCGKFTGKLNFQVTELNELLKFRWFACDGAWAWLKVKQCLTCYHESIIFYLNETFSRIHRGQINVFMYLKQTKKPSLISLRMKFAI